MITRQDTRQVTDALILAAILYFSYHPLEMFTQDKWDGMHWKRVVYLTQQQAWEELKTYIERMGETYLRELKQTLIHSVSSRLYRTRRAKRSKRGCTISKKTACRR